MLVVCSIFEQRDGDFFGAHNVQTAGKHCNTKLKLTIRVNLPLNNLEPRVLLCFVFD